MNAIRLDGQVVLISGAAGGIGAATARRLVTRGATVVLADLAEMPLQELAAELGGQATAIPLDVTDPAACQRAVAETLTRHGRIDVVWSNAGISAYGPAELMPPDTWRNVIAINLVGAYNLVQAGLPAVIESRGHVAFTASWASFAHSPGHSAYAATKAAVEAMGNSLRSELAHQGVTVGVFHPGWIATPMVTDKIEHQPAFNALLRSLPAPLRKVTPVEDMADVLADAVAARVSKVIYPRTGWILHAVRPVLPTRLVSAGGRKAAASIRSLYGDSRASDQNNLLEGGSPRAIAPTHEASPDPTPLHVRIWASARHSRLTWSALATRAAPSPTAPHPPQRPSQSSES